MFDETFYRGKRVFVTGHTGFKGSWLCRILKRAGAIVTGYSLEAPTTPSLFALSDCAEGMTSVIGDVADLDSLWAAFDAAKPEIVFHLAAQPIVRESYRDPVGTYRTNVMGTANILECVRRSDTVRSFLNVTTDKVYRNNEWMWGYRENEALDGYDPYSNSKSCSELVTASYKRSFFADGNVAISTARAGNVIGGGDFAPDRIIPDAVRAAAEKKPLLIRNPHSIRPYQHVLEPLFVYLTIAQAQYEDIRFADAYNVGPEERDCATTGMLADIFTTAWGEGMTWTNGNEGGPHEANILKLDCTKIKQTFAWKPVWAIPTAIAKVVEWSKVWLAGGDIKACMDAQIAAYRADAESN